MDSRDGDSGNKGFASGRLEILIEEVIEIEQLIDEWRPATDPDTRWALHMLEQCLKHRQRAIRRFLH